MSNIQSFSNEVEQRRKELFDTLESIDLDSIRSQGITISFGGKTFNFKDVEVDDTDNVEEKIRREFREKLNDQQQRIRKKINEKINQLLVMQQTKANELDRKEAELRRKYENRATMPEISVQHLSKGLSVVKGDERDKLYWCYRAVYNPKFVNITSEGRKKLPDRLINRMKKNIIILIKTKGRNVTNVSTRTVEGNGSSLPYFQHYHQTDHGNGDCWGSWDYPKNWSSADDILRIAKDAESVLETVNGGSIAKRGPAGLPRWDTLQRNVADVEANVPLTDYINSFEDDDDDDVWSAA